ncbi:MAG TPA: sulfatase-like hydrolase/transferase [Candidatus Aminicenantes bacterium]|nr:sulfatase-like hydrolase/transferase [Candidatus Aminicenantes bacterium]HRY65836.1 sulfatase-like hydrolase/transferase [Candidatus Aminicenantes bacterium]HRZ72838.1 sulfatase-like hydrolase/transferase [Candidatus Aminicenantes bacterium]
MSNRTKSRKKKDQRLPGRPAPATTALQGPTAAGPARRGRRAKRLAVVVAGLGLALAAFLFVLLRPRTRFEGDSGTNVLLITLDTTRADRIGSYGWTGARTPSLDFLASNGIRFANAYCQVPLTLPSHSSLMTGTYPLYHQVRNNGSYRLKGDLATLAEVLKDAGFRTAAFVSSFTVNSRFGLNQGFEVYDDRWGSGGALEDSGSERRAAATAASFSRWLEANGRQKFFGWVHFYDPHLPYDPPSPFKEQFAGRPYDGEIASMDESIGRIVDQLRDQGLLENTLIVVAGDHGEALGEKGELDHGLYIYDVTLKVPLIIYGGKRLPRGIVVPSRVRLVDVMPTVLEILGLPQSGRVQGLSLLDHILGRRKDDLGSYIESYYPRENYNWSELVGLIDGNWKYIRAPREELYDLAGDPAEERNEIGREGRRGADLRRKLEEMVREQSSALEAGRVMTSEEKERLRSLGYLAGSAPAGAPGQALPDPKDKIEEFAGICRAKILEFEGDLGKAVESYRALIASYPAAPDHYSRLADVHIRQGDLEAAAGVLAQGIGRVPEAPLLRSKLSLVCFRLGRFEEASRAAGEALDMDPLDYNALVSSGWIMSRSGRYGEAIDYFRRALDIEPGNRSLRLDQARALAAAGRQAEALEIYGTLKDEDPNDYAVHQESGIILASQGNMAAALESLGKAVSLHPAAETYLNYAAVLERVGNRAEAVKYLRLYLQTTTEGETPRKAAVRKALEHLETTGRS